MTGPTKGLGGVGKEVGGMDMEEEVNEAYEVVKQIGVSQRVCGLHGTGN
jgi:dynein heavy chain 1